MSNVAVIIQILFITIGMFILGMILNYVLGVRKEKLYEMRDKALNIQARMRNAQALGDYQLLVKLQQESILFMKQMMKKQVIPMCIRCFIFIGIFAILGVIYSDYGSGLLPFPILIFGSGWVSIYLIFSLTISISIFTVKRLYSRYIKKEPPTRGYLNYLISMISPPQQNNEIPFQMASDTQYHPEVFKKNSVEEGENKSPREDSWKDRLEE